MKIANFRLKLIDGQRVRPGLVANDRILDLAQRPNIGGPGEADALVDTLSLVSQFPEIRSDLIDLLDQSTHGDAFLNAGMSLDDAKLVAPIERPGKLICLAGNYREHIKESGFVAPEQTEVVTQQLFLKPSSSIIGDEDDILIGSNNVRVGWETELAVVIGKKGRNISSSDAMNYVFGYTILNDVSERGLNSKIENRRQREMDRFLDWLAGKWFDSFAPCGPWIVTADEVPDPHNLEITLTINGELRQQGNTRDMIFRIPEQIAYASSIMTLEPGDIISTGTPAGAGIGGRDTSLHDGDTLICEIEKIGKLKNRVRYVE
jgi:2-keto-4-pentenoate hydratase/2-oxohepta-3-ene-1,7-dioic acid hydratase in catechol pathway